MNALKRKLTAILSADVAGYSRLMREDEYATIKMLNAYRGTIDTLIRQHHGRVVDMPGDNILAEFGSVVDSVQAAVAIQRELKSESLPAERVASGSPLEGGIHIGKAPLGLMVYLF